MKTNIFNKKVTDMNKQNLCDKDVNDEDVKKLYKNFKNICDKYIQEKEYSTSQKYYVYIWYAKSIPRKIFYVGKGTKSRYRHIYNDIKNYREGKQKNNIRFEQYSIIEEIYGIECEIIKNNLNEKEALIYEECIKLKCLKNGEVLLNVEGIPEEYLPEGWDFVETDIPKIEKSRFRERYLNENQDRQFDIILKSNLIKSYIYTFFSSGIQNETFNLIKEYIKHKGGKLYKSISKGTKSVIVCGFLRAETYEKLKKEGKQIYSLLDVIDFIKLDFPELKASDELILNTEEKQVIQKQIEAFKFIKNMLIENGAIKDYIFMENENIHYMSKCIFIKIYKKSKKIRLTIPLEYFKNAKLSVVRKTSWKADFECNEVNNLIEIKEIIPNWIKEANNQSYHFKEFILPNIDNNLCII